MTKVIRTAATERWKNEKKDWRDSHTNKFSDAKVPFQDMLMNPHSITNTCLSIVLQEWEKMYIPPGCLQSWSTRQVF